MYDGGPAFPALKPLFRYSGDGIAMERVAAENDGMSIRDYFAAAALQGLMLRDPKTTEEAKRCAVDAYTVADAMLEAREAK